MCIEVVANGPISCIPTINSLVHLDQLHCCKYGTFKNWSLTGEGQHCFWSSPVLLPSLEDKFHLKGENEKESDFH